MSNIDKIKINDTDYGVIGKLPYGVCGTAAGTAAKTVTVDSENFVLETGVTVIVKFTKSNSAASPTLNVNSTGAKPIMRYGTATASTGTTTTGWTDGAVQMFTYDGTNWVRDYWNNTTYTFHGAVSTIKDSNLTASRALISNSSGKVAVSAVTSTELGYLDGVTSAIQTQLDGKSRTGHTHSATSINSGQLSTSRLPNIPITKGGTGASNVDEAITNLGLDALTSAELDEICDFDELPDGGTVPIASKVGTGYMAVGDGLDVTSAGLVSVASNIQAVGTSADYVVEQGTSGGWIYRKWNSGVAECWGSYTFPTSGGAVQLILPFNMANTDYVVLGTPAHNGSIIARHGCYNAAGNNANAVGSFYYSVTISSNYNAIMNFHVIGRWK